MKILMVSPFPPLRDGVGKYAAQEVEFLRDEGHEVDVLAPVACAAHYVENFKTFAPGLLKIRGYARRYERTILQYQPAHFHSRGSGLSRILSNFWMALAFRSTANLTIVCHEVEYPPQGWPKWRPEVVLERFAWRGARHVEFHTDREVTQMQQRLGVVPRSYDTRAHGRYFRPAVCEDRSAARHRLGMDPKVKLLLCIGFMQPHKGFDRAIRAFRQVPGKDARLMIVGSIRAETTEHRGYLYELLDLAASDDRVEVHERMMSDEEFDRWIIASDVVVLPYREIWSSGVLERAHVLDRPVIATPTGGIAEQVHEADVLAADDQELARAIAEVVGEGPPVAPAAMSLTEAMSFVEEESGRRRDPLGKAGVDRAIGRLDRTRGVRPIILPSERRLIGRFLDIVKRVARRGLGWLLTPMLGQINEFERLTVEALEALVAESRGTDPSQYSVFDYEGFEGRFRGESESIKEKQRSYVKEFVGRAPVLDVGCGRGEFLELLREAGIEASGVDLSTDMVLVARRKGLNVEHGDGVAYLRSVRPGTLGGIMAAQVVEHMPPRSLVELLVAARKALRSGGILICETINPQSLFALANWYVMDLTHAKPIHPSTLQFLCEEIGFEHVEVRYLSDAWPDRESVTVDDDSPGWAQRMAKGVDDEIQKIGDVVFGPQDYALIARVP